MQEIKTLGNTLVVGDIMRSISTFDFRENKPAGKMLWESAHSSHSIWTTCLLPIN